MFLKKQSYLNYRLKLPELGLTMRLPSKPAIMPPVNDSRIGLIRTIINTVGTYGPEFYSVTYDIVVVYQIENDKTWQQIASEVIDREHMIEKDWTTISVNDEFAYLNSSNSFVEKWHSQSARYPYQYICTVSTGMFVYVIKIAQKEDKLAYFKDFMKNLDISPPKY